MKAERRHELQTNDLAQALANFLERYRSHGPTILWCVVAAMAVFVAVSLWNTRRGTYQARAWEEFDRVRMADAKVRPKRLKDLVDRYAGTDIANWARLDLQYHPKVAIKIIV